MTRGGIILMSLKSFIGLATILTPLIAWGEFSSTPNSSENIFVVSGTNYPSTTTRPLLDLYPCAGPSILKPGESLKGGDKLCAVGTGGSFQFQMQRDRNMVIAKKIFPLLTGEETSLSVWWKSDTGIQGINENTKLLMQNDCNLVASTEDGKAIWQSGTHNAGTHCWAELDGNGVLGVYTLGSDSNPQALWTSQAGLLEFCGAPASVTSGWSTQQAGTFLCSAGKTFFAKLEPEGSFSVYRQKNSIGVQFAPEQIWNSNAGSAPATLVFQNDCNLVLSQTGASTALWDSGTSYGKQVAPCTLTLQEGDGNLVLISPKGDALWASLLGRTNIAIDGEIENCGQGPSGKTYPNRAACLDAQRIYLEGPGGNLQAIYLFAHSITGDNMDFKCDTCRKTASLTTQTTAPGSVASVAANSIKQTLSLSIHALGQTLESLKKDGFDCIKDKGDGWSCVSTVAAGGVIIISIVYPPGGVAIALVTVTFSATECTIAGLSEDEKSLLKDDIDKACAEAVLSGTLALVTNIGGKQVTVKRPPKSEGYTVPSTVYNQNGLSNAGSSGGRLPSNNDLVALNPNGAVNAYTPPAVLQRPPATTIEIPKPPLAQTPPSPLPTTGITAATLPILNSPSLKPGDVGDASSLPPVFAAPWIKPSELPTIVLPPLQPAGGDVPLPPAPPPGKGKWQAYQDKDGKWYAFNENEKGTYYEYDPVSGEWIPRRVDSGNENKNITWLLTLIKDNSTEVEWNIDDQKWKSRFTSTLAEELVNLLKVVNNRSLGVDVRSKANSSLNALEKLTKLLVEKGLPMVELMKITLSDFLQRAQKTAEELRGSKTSLPDDITKFSPEDLPALYAAEILKILSSMGVKLTSEQDQLLKSYKSISVPEQILVKAATPNFRAILTLAAQAGVPSEQASGEDARIEISPTLESIRLAAIIYASEKLDPAESAKFLLKAWPIREQLSYRPISMLSSPAELMKSRSYRPADYHPDDFDENGFLKEGRSPKAISKDWMLAGVAMPGMSGNRQFSNSMRIFYWDKGGELVSHLGNRARVAENWKRNTEGVWELQSVEWFLGVHVAPLQFKKINTNLESGETGPSTLAETPPWELGETSSCAACHVVRGSFSAMNQFSNDKPWGRGRTNEFWKLIGADIAKWHGRIGGLEKMPEDGNP